MFAAVLELIEIYDGEGAVIFIECQNCGNPRFEVMNSADVKAFAGSQMPVETFHSFLVALNGLYDNPLMLASMVRSIAKDVTMHCVYAELVELAKFLVMEAQKQQGAAYVSAEGSLGDKRDAKRLTVPMVGQLSHCLTMPIVRTFSVLLSMSATPFLRLNECLDTYGFSDQCQVDHFFHSTITCVTLISIASWTSSDLSSTFNLNTICRQ
ncbi:hypothetical protein F4604DRAFT_1682999 [Suillus subluteus]|nr:hypothetical protein F4604DRAFT_1682999 [Suillus subluteus]